MTNAFGFSTQNTAPSIKKPEALQHIYEQVVGTYAELYKLATVLAIRYGEKDDKDQYMTPWVGSTMLRAANSNGDMNFFRMLCHDAERETTTLYGKTVDDYIPNPINRRHPFEIKPGDTKAYLNVPVIYPFGDKDDSKEIVGTTNEAPTTRPRKALLPTSPAFLAVKSTVLSMGKDLLPEDDPLQLVISANYLGLFESVPELS